jgi:hypothetical protein
VFFGFSGFKEIFVMLFEIRGNFCCFFKFGDFLAIFFEILKFGKFFVSLECWFLWIIEMILVELFCVVWAFEKGKNLM